MPPARVSHSSSTPQIDTKERHVDDVRKNLELACIEADKVLADQVETDMQIQVGGCGVKCDSWF